MYLEDDKTLNEGSEGVVAPKETEIVEQDSLWDDTTDESEDDVLEEDNQELLDSESEDGDVAPPQKPKQDKETNSAFAALRRKEEEIAKREEALRQREMEKQIESEYLNPEKIWSFADENGITEDMARKFLALEAQQKAQEQALQLQARNTKLTLQKEALKNDPLYQHFQGEVDEIVLNNPDIDLEVALDYVVGKNRKNILDVLSKKTTKQTLANVQDNLKRRSIKSSDGESVDTSVGLSNFAKRFNEFAGIDSKEVAKHVSKRKKEFF